MNAADNLMLLSVELEPPGCAFYSVVLARGTLQECVDEGSKYAGLRVKVLIPHGRISKADGIRLNVVAAGMFQDAHVLLGVGARFESNGWDPRVPEFEFRVTHETEGVEV